MSLENNDKILSLNEKEKVRKKTAVFIGSVNNNTHLAKEAIANGIDEMYNNFKNGTLVVELLEDMETISVEDTGRGIPIHTKENRRLLFETTFAGTKLEANEKTTTGTNGCGMTVTQYTSIFFEVQSKYKGINHIVRYENCEEVYYKEEECDINEHGTKVVFKLDKEIYPKISYTIEEVKDMTKRSIITTPNIKSIFKHGNNIEEYNYKNLKEYFVSVSNNNIDSDILIANNKKIEEDDETNTIQFVLASFKDNPIQESYLNMNYLPEKGTLHDGLMLAVRLFIDRYIKEKGMYNNKEKSISIKDVESVIGYVLSNLSTKVEYQNQTKFSTAKELYKKISREFVLEQLEYFKVENPMELERIAKAILINKRANERATASIDRIKKKLQTTTNITEKLENYIDCELERGGELFIAEGWSAAGAILLARDANYQAVYSLKGKPLNILKADYEKIFKSKEIEGLIKVMGCGIEINNKNHNLFNINDLKFDKIIIAVDMDPDGIGHICPLLLTVFYKLTPELLKQNKIYVLMTPLFEIRNKKTDEMIYAYSEEMKNNIIKGKENLYDIGRCKGLGETNPEIMADCIKNENPNYLPINWDDAKNIAESFEVMMGNLDAERKEYIEENLHLYIGKGE